MQNRIMCVGLCTLIVVLSACATEHPDDDTSCPGCSGDTATDDDADGNGHCLDVELCDDKDNDCNGETNEGFDLGLPCVAGIGSCERTGEIACMNLESSACNAESGNPTSELCDELDNDCDGDTDEDFVELGAACTVGNGACAHDGEWGCDTRTGGISCDAFAGSPTAERCNSIDDDCDGITDADTHYHGTRCVNGQRGICERAGTMMCNLDIGALVCDAPNGSSSSTDETCNGLDDNCNGYTDEGIGVEVIGTTDGECEPHILTCTDGDTIVFHEGRDPQPEQCDELDNDCDGETDEDFADLLGSECSVGDGICLRSGVLTCALARGLHCDLEPGVPTEEICNGRDDDCDGDTDEDFTVVLGTSCTRGTGACEHAGVRVCAADGTTRCDASIGEPGVEACNGVDDDCDGITDIDTAGWGASCSNEQLGVCARTGIKQCNLDTSSLACSAVDGSASRTEETCNGLDDNCNGVTDDGLSPRVSGTSDGECQVTIISCVHGRNEILQEGRDPEPDICDDLDNDCDGETDEDFMDVLGTDCSNGTGACEGFGEYVCSHDGGVRCDASTNPPAVERCDHIDNDCNGETDESFDGLDDPCSVGIGACERFGVVVCTEDGVATTCAATDGSPEMEFCDGVDNDCNGIIDTDTADYGESCSNGLYGACELHGTLVCNAASETLVCDAPDGADRATEEQCNGLDDNCDGSTDESFWNIGNACPVGIGVCTREGVVVCTNGGDGTQCVGTPDSPIDESCNSMDDDCDGTTDTDTVGWGDSCSNSQFGICARTGTMQCDLETSSLTCNAPDGSVSSTEEICNGLDDDCDGVTDGSRDIDGNTILLNRACYEGPVETRNVGVCRDGMVQCISYTGPIVGISPNTHPETIITCSTMEDLCYAGSWSSCSGEITPGTEICDTQDNDCDNTVNNGAFCTDIPAPVCLDNTTLRSFSGPGTCHADGSCSYGVTDEPCPVPNHYTSSCNAGVCDIACGAGSWEPTPLAGAPAPRYTHTAVWTGTEMLIWGGYLNSGDRFHASDDYWSPMTVLGAPSARYKHTAVWTGTEMIVWGGGGVGGGDMRRGGRYTTQTDSWQPMSTADAPSARYWHTAVWTGSEMIVWGGYGDGFLNNGARYNPATDSWLPITSTNAPLRRAYHTATWTGSEMIVWGGGGDEPGDGRLSTGSRYNPEQDSWNSTSINNAPSARYWHTAVWTGSEMIVWSNGSGGRYNPSTDSWTTVSTDNAPVEMGDHHTAVWTGSTMIVWGMSVGTSNGGGQYDPILDAWCPSATIDAPDGRYFHTAVWTGSEMIVWGGDGCGGGGDCKTDTGGQYTPP